MRQFKTEFAAAKALQDWTKANEIFRDLLTAAGVEEISDGAPDGINKELAEYRNRQAAGNMVGGKKI